MYKLTILCSFGLSYDLTGGSWPLFTGGGVSVISRRGEGGLGGEQGGGARGGA